jgi:F-type H+-transporting ATPase subunit delta
MKSLDAPRWAEALIAAAGDNAGQAVCALEEAARAFGESGALTRIPSGRTAERRLASAFAKAVPTAQAAPVARLVLLLARHSRLSEIGAVARAARSLMDAREGLFRVRMETAAPLTEASKESFRATLLHRTGARKIEFDERIVPELLGGARVVVGCERIDGSLRRRLETMAAAMGVANRGGGKW